MSDETKGATVMVQGCRRIVTDKHKRAGTVRSRSTARITFALGTIIGGCTYFFTALPEFKTEKAARDYATARPMHGRVVIFEHSELFHRGINWGSDDRAVGEVP